MLLKCSCGAAEEIDPKGRREMKLQRSLKMLPDLRNLNRTILTRKSLFSINELPVLVNKLSSH